MRKFIRILFVGSLAIVLVTASAGLYSYRSLQQVPDFYTQALARLQGSTLTPGAQAKLSQVAAWLLSGEK